MDARVLTKDLRLRIPLDLCFFADSSSEKTEKATPKKRNKAREEGQVAKSQEIGTAAMLLAGFAGLALFAGGILTGIIDLFAFHFLLLPDSVDIFESVFLARHVAWVMGQILLICAPLFAVGMVVGLITNVVQVGWKITPKAFKPKMSKFNPIKGMKRIFSMQSVMNLVKSLLKFTLIITVVVFMLMGELEIIPSVMDMELGAAMSYFGGLVVRMGLTIGVMYIFIAVLDFAYTKWKHEKDLKMTKQEVKEEWKQAEGNPQIKGKIRQKMREVSMRRMMQNVPQADVIITNPTHYAVALKYDMLGALGGAPILVAKGVDFMAKRIKDVAAENDIPVVENPPLARAIYNDVDIDKEIPEELYLAVAEIMAYVFKLKNRV